jgi:hypothetical protein
MSVEWDPPPLAPCKLIKAEPRGKTDYERGRGVVGATTANAVSSQLILVS